MTLIFLLALALSPGLAIILYIYLKDKHEPEPIRPLVIGFVSGMVSFVIAIGIGAISFIPTCNQASPGCISFQR